MEKLATARRVIAESLKIARAPLVLWSGGKDSMLLLWLIREVRPDAQVAYFRGFEDETKHAFAGEIIESYGLNMADLQPVARDVVAKDGHIELIEVYEVAPGVHLYFPIEAEPGHVPGPGSLCAVLKLNEPRAARCLDDFDCVFIGHRGDDADPVHGDIPLADYVHAQNSVQFVYPLKDFTESDVWAASAALSVPQNTLRYRDKDMRFNADYWPLCTRCLEPQEGETVECPKAGGPVYALNRFINPEQRREEWRQSFINLEVS